MQMTRSSSSQEALLKNLTVGSYIDMHRVGQRAEESGLVLNRQKTKFIVFIAKNKFDIEPMVMLNGNVYERT